MSAIKCALFVSK